MGDGPEAMGNKATSNERRVESFEKLLLFVMPEVFPDRKLRGQACRASMLLLFLDSRQKIAGMTKLIRDSAYLKKY